jgi:excisionase family DNA binding protein
MGVRRADIEVKGAVFKLITLKQAAEMLGVTKRTVLRREGAGKMPPRFEAGRGKRFRFADIEAMVKTNFTDSIELITLKEAAEMLGTHERTIRRWVAAGKMPPRIGKGKAKKFWRTDIQSLLHQC